MQADPKAAAVLRDVFRLTNRGTVLVVSDIDGIINIGDRMVVDARETHVVGIEMIDFSSRQKTMTGTVGLLIHDSDDEASRTFLGQSVIFHGKG